MWKLQFAAYQSPSLPSHLNKGLLSTWVWHVVTVGHHIHFQEIKFPISDGSVGKESICNARDNYGMPGKTKGSSLTPLNGTDNITNSNSYSLEKYFALFPVPLCTH